MEDNKYKQCLRIFLLGSVIFLTGCSFLSPLKTEHEDIYLLTSHPPAIATKVRHYQTLLILQTEASPAFNTTRMAYSIKPYQIAYFAKNRWGETPPQMLEPLIIKTLSGTHHFAAVASSPFIGRYDYTLSTRILDFKQNFIFQPARLELTVRVEILQTRTNRIIATKEFIITEPMLNRTPYSGVFAANRAVEVFLKQLARFIIKVT